MQPFIIMTDYAEVHTAVESMKLGSIDYIPKQLVEDKLGRGAHQGGHRDPDKSRCHPADQGCRHPADQSSHQNAFQGRDQDQPERQKVTIR